MISLFEFDEIGSTNDQARTLINDGVYAPFWVLTHSQTKGRGRLSRNWHSPRGNLYCSCVVNYGRELPSPLVSFIAAIALFDSIKEFAPNANAKLKWPNDILIDGAKISGILLETHSYNRENYLIIGLGLNIINAPQLPNRQTCSLSQFTHNPPKPREFLDVLIPKFEALFKDFSQNGFEKLRLIWIENAIGIGENITIDQNDRKLNGVFKTIGENGELILETSHGCIFINSGDVIFQQI